MRTPIQVEPISQNFGYEYDTITRSSYENYNPQRLSDILRKINFRGKLKKTFEE